jgi:hypothetical protein
MDHVELRMHLSIATDDIAAQTLKPPGYVARLQGN